MLEIAKDFLPKIKDFNGTICLKEPLAAHTTWKIGGPADILLIPHTIEDIQLVLKVTKKENRLLTVIGKGSNILVKDKGIRGIVLKIGDHLSFLEQKDIYNLKAGAGLRLSGLLEATCSMGLGGLEFAAGIPATLGGAVMMNAGLPSLAIGDLVQKVEGFDGNGELHEFQKEEISFGYRRSNLGEMLEVVTAINLELKPALPQEIKEKINYFLQERKAKQPLCYPSAGSVFKNPKDVPAGKLIEEAGLKGLRCGGAIISEKHANFILNLGSATATDVLRLIDKVKENVWQKFKIELELEIKVLGE